MELNIERRQKTIRERESGESPASLVNNNVTFKEEFGLDFAQYKLHLSLGPLPIVNNKNAEGSLRRG